MMTGIIYKYRSLENFKNFVDILINNRLYASNYKSMNDPMEGHYYYSEGVLKENIRNKIFEEKNAQKFCCLAKNSIHTLMWSHYANGHKGVAIGVKIDKKKYTVKEIEYFNDLTLIDRYDSMTAKEILSRKLIEWEYEQEVRVFLNNSTNNFIDIEIVEIILGININDEDENLIRKLIEKINPKIQIKKNCR